MILRCDIAFTSQNEKLQNFHVSISARKKNFKDDWLESLTGIVNYDRINQPCQQVQRLLHKLRRGRIIMAVLSNDFTDLTALVYDSYGNYLISTFVLSHDREARHVVLDRMPEEVKANENCKLIILTSPTPCEFVGKAKKTGGNYYIALIQGQEKEGRIAPRYSINNPALITAVIVDGEVHRIQTPVKITLINISTTGLRFRAPYYSFDVGDDFQLDMFIGKNQKKATVRVINTVDNDTESSDYGCRFLLIQ